jgi:hypothetical protein
MQCSVVLLGFFIYSASDAGVKHLSESYSAVQILFLTGIFGTIFLIRQFGKPPALPVRLEKALPFLR